jgi:molybdate transport system substrate-binding protein
MPLCRRGACALFLVLAVAWPAAAADSVTIFAAASLKEAVDDAAAAFKAKTGTDVKASYAASSALAKQIEAGAPADLFASADTKWMDYLGGKSLIQTDSRIDLLGNSLVVVAPKASPLDALALSPAAFDEAIGDGKWVTGTVASVPVGIYAREALTSLGIWAAAEPKLAQTDNVRSALQFVARGEAKLGIVYRTDANAEPGVKVVASIPASSHSPIVYPFALTATSTTAAAGAFLAFLASDDAIAIFEKRGFVGLKRPGK